jgi:hypothetical protein
MFGPVGKVDIDSTYKFAFGDTPDEMQYEGPLEVTKDYYPDMQSSFQKWATDVMGMDFTQEGIEKAANVGATSGGAGYVPMPLAYDQGVIDITRRFTPVTALIPKVTNRGLTANYHRLTARGDASWGPEDPTLEETDDTKELASETIRYLRITGRVTGVAEVGGAHFESTMRSEMINKTQTLNETLEQALINGDNSSNPYQPDGLAVQLTAANGANVDDLSGATPTLENLDDMVNDCFMDKGAPNLFITDPYTASTLKNQITANIRYQDPYMSVAWGLKALSINTVVGEIPLIVSQFMPTTAAARKIFCVNTSFMEQRVLQDITFQRLAKTTDAEKFMLKTYRTLVNKFPEGMGTIDNCA